MCEAPRDPDLLVTLLCKFDPDPTAKCGGAPADVHSHVEHAAAYYTHQFALRMRRRLEMQPAQDSPAGTRLVVLDKVHVHANRGVKSALVEGLAEEPTLVAEYLRLQHQHPRQCCGCDSHQ